MKIYTIIKSYIDMTDPGAYPVKAFKTLEAAQNYLEKLKDEEALEMDLTVEELKALEDNNEEGTTTYEEDDWSFSTWIIGEYADTVIKYEIETVELVEE